MIFSRMGVPQRLIIPTHPSLIKAPILVILFLLIYLFSLQIPLVQERRRAATVNEKGSYGGARNGGETRE